jgi:hypothetical protein
MIQLWILIFSNAVAVYDGKQAGLNRCRIGIKFQLRQRRCRRRAAMRRGFGRYFPQALPRRGSCQNQCAASCQIFRRHSRPLATPRAGRLCFLYIVSPSSTILSRIRNSTVDRRTASKSRAEMFVCLRVWRACFMLQPQHKQSTI